MAIHCLISMIHYDADWNRNTLPNKMDQCDVTGTPTTVSSWPIAIQNSTDLNTDLSMKWALLAAKKAVQREPFLKQKRNKFFALLYAVETQVTGFHIAVFYPIRSFTVPLLDMRNWGKPQNKPFIQQQLQVTYKGLFCNCMQCSCK
jgi:hypothetical protein